MNESRKEKPVELLAPAGGMRALKAVLRAGADAVYLSGKRFGMRGHRSSFHFDDAAMKQAVAESHAAGARIYITVNNLLGDAELRDALSYIRFLEDLGADAVILQDLGLLQELGRSPPGLEVHASTMMNVHSSPFAAFLKELGVTRIITSRDISLATIREMAARTGVEMEYFIHGDMCSVQSGLCHLSGVLFGQSSNRGRCLKPCRWPWRIVKEGNGGQGGAAAYLLARKDMCLYHALPEIIESGVAALKIEGRMRPAEYLEEVVGIYRRALDRYFENPFLYREDPLGAGRLHAIRARDFTSSHAFGNPGPASMGFTGEREPRFFSTPIPDPGLDASGVEPDPLPLELPQERPALSIALNALDALEAVIKEAPDWIYLAPRFPEPGQGFTNDALSQALARCRDAGIQSAVILPPVTPDGELDYLPRFVQSLDPVPDAWMAGNAGQLPVLRERTAGRLMADSLFNAFNGAALDLLAGQGIDRVSLSPEISINHLLSIPRPHPLEVELPVHGPVQAMFLQDCILRLAFDRHFDPGSCRRFCDGGTFALMNEAGERFPIRITEPCRSALFFPRHLCLLHRLCRVVSTGAGSLRLNLFGYAPEDAAAVTAIYRKSLDRIFSRDEAWFDREAMRVLNDRSGCGLFEAGAEHGVVPLTAARDREEET